MLFDLKKPNILNSQTICFKNIYYRAIPLKIRVRIIAKINQFHNCQRKNIDKLCNYRNNNLIDLIIKLKS